MRIAHLADFHLPNDPGELLFGISPHAHLAAAVGVLQSLESQPDLIVAGGDMFNDGASADYGLLREAFSALSQPVHLVMGNHDHLAALRRTAQPPLSPSYPGYTSFDFEGYHIVLLHSASTGDSYGLLDEAQLEWLDKDLECSHPRPVLVFAHHPPVHIGIPWLDKVNLQNMDEFWATVAPYLDRLCGVFVAHVHQQLICSHSGVLVASCPATSWQFSSSPDAKRAERSNEAPGFNLLDLAGGQASVRTLRFEPKASRHRTMGESV